MIDILPLHLTFRAQAETRLPDRLGPMLRGAFGFSLKRLVCVMRGRPCTGCPLERACVFPGLFSPPPPEDTAVMRLYDKAPPPFALRPAPGGAFGPSSALDVELVLIGQAARLAPFALRAFRDAGENGFGRDRVPFRLDEVRDRSGASGTDASGRIAARPFHIEAPDPAPHEVAIRFSSPVRLQADGALVRPDSFTASVLAMAAVRRLGLLAQFYGEPLAVDFAALKAAASRVVLRAANLCWSESTRYSTRQRQPLLVGGLIGEIRIDLSQAPETWPFLYAATHVGLGKSTTMGLGAIEVFAS